MWDMLEVNKLFKCHSPEGVFDYAYHLAGMVAIMGPPPVEFLKRSEISKEFWDADGKWHCAQFSKYRNQLEMRIPG